MNDMTFGRQLTLGFMTAGFVLLVVAFSGYRSTHDLIEKDRWVQHTHHVRRQIREVLSAVKDAETGQRGYIVTGNEAYLDSYVYGSSQVVRALDELRKLVGDNPPQLRRVEAMRPLLESKLAEMKSTVDARRTQGFEAAAKVVANGEGKRAMDELRRYVAEMDADEAGLLDSRREESEVNAALAKNVILWGAVVGLCMTAIVGVFIARSLGKQVGFVAGDMRTSSSALQSSANQQVAGAKEQATAMTEIHTTMTELLATSRQIAESAQRVALVASQTAGSAKAGDLTVARTREAIVGIKRQVDLVVQYMLDLGKKSQHIGSVLDIVAELSEQTNILAINATIEAAGAGEAGKRFAVVAEEIRHLADRVGGSTKEIRALIEDVRGAVNTTVMATETSAKAVDGGSQQFTEVAASFADIAALVDTTTQSAREIELSTKQQSTAVEQVNLAIASVTQGSRESEASALLTLQTAKQLSALSSNLLKIVDAGA